MRASDTAAGRSGGLAALSVSAAVAVSVIYLPQPMLTDLALSLDVSTSAVSGVATAVQVGYALGIFFLVPLSDRVQPRRQISIQILALVIGLLITAAMPRVAAVAAGFFLVGLVANIAQLIIPAAARLAPQDRRGATTSALVGALLVGIFGGRVVAGVLVHYVSWRWVLVAFAFLVLGTLPLVRSAMPQHLDLGESRSSVSQLWRSSLRLLSTSSVLRQSAVMQFFTFGTFSSVWTVMVLHLTGKPFGWSVLQAGLFGLVGLAAGLLTPFGGRFVDRFGPTAFSGVLLVLLLAATAATVADAEQIWLFGASTFVLTWANQSIQSANQNRVLVANPGRPAQANTIFMVVVFLGGSFGALAGPVAFDRGGMVAVAVQGVAFVLIALCVWVVSSWYERHQDATATATATATRGTRR